MWIGCSPFTFSLDDDLANSGRTRGLARDGLDHRHGRSYDPAVRTLSLASILSDTVSIWRRDLRPLTILAAALEIPIVLAEVALHITPSLADFVEGSVVVSGGVLVVLIYGSLSHHFLAGLLERVVAADRHGHRRPSLGEVLRRLPWSRLIAADLVLTALILAGLAAFVVPGLVAMTWFAVVLPLINLERRPVLATFSRSYHLVRGHSWRVALVAVTAFVVPEVVLGIVAAFTDTGNATLDALVHAIPAVILLPLAALPIVIMTFELVALDAGAAGGEAKVGVANR
jgi:hypothetical protein